MTTTAANRLRAQAQQAITDYKRDAAKGDPIYPQWAFDVLAMLEVSPIRVTIAATRQAASLLEDISFRGGMESACDEIETRLGLSGQPALEPQPAALTDEQIKRLFYKEMDCEGGWALYEVTPGDVIRFARALLQSAQPVQWPSPAEIEQMLDADEEEATPIVLEFNEARCRQAYENTFHKVRAEIRYDDWKRVWEKAIEWCNYDLAKISQPVQEAEPQGEPVAIASITVIRVNMGDEWHAHAHGENWVVIRKTPEAALQAALAKLNGVAQPVRTELDYEKRRAIMEGERNHATDEYFKARTPFLDTLQNRLVFEAGFTRGYDAAPTVTQEAAQTNPELMKLVTSALLDADHLAEVSERLLAAMNRLTGAKDRNDIYQTAESALVLQNAEEGVSEYWRAVREATFEYRKRVGRFRAAQPVSNPTSAKNAVVRFDSADMIPARELSTCRHCGFRVKLNEPGQQEGEARADQA